MKPLDHYLSIIETALSQINYPKEPAGLYEPIAYTLQGGGKRLRPVLTLAACDAFCGDPEKALNQAMAVEMFHNFTLLHDDVMDRADMRRGRPTVHVRWDDRTAILSGDCMLTLATMMVMRGADDQSLRPAVNLLNRTAVEIYEGQQLDMDFETRRDVTLDDYLEMIRLKTSVLLGCACQMGAIMGGASEQSQQAMYSFGEKLGLAFQLQDDYLDTFGDPIVFGKEIGGDIANDKKTWLMLTAVAEDQTGVMTRELSTPSDRQEKIEAVREVYRQLNLEERCHQLIDVYVAQAVKELERADLKLSAYEFFKAIAEKSRTRVN